MGAGFIIQSNISKECESLWKKVPSIPQLNINLSKYDKSFVNFASLVGAYAIYKSSLWLAKKTFSWAKKTRKMPTAEQLQNRYGKHSWALIADCKGNEDFCILLAQRGFNLILCGQDGDLNIAKDRVLHESGEIYFKMQEIVVDWEIQSKNLKLYEQLQQKLKDFDISIIVMPLITKKKNLPTHEQMSPAYQHFYLLTRFFGPKLKWRPTASAIIIPSTEKVDLIDHRQNGVTRAVQSGIDAFGRILQYELKGSIDILIARGSAENALMSLGKEAISH